MNPIEKTISYFFKLSLLMFFMNEEKFGFWAFKLSGIMIVLFLLQIFVSGFTDLFVLNDLALKGQVWRFVSSIFLHGDIGHLAYNLFALLLFGSIVERLVGTKKFLFGFFFTGIVANLLSVGFYSSSLGASGAIFGIIGMLIILRPGMAIWAFGMPMPVFIAGILWAAGDILGAYAFIVGNPIDNTGNFAHLFGMAFGLIYAIFLRFNLKTFGRNRKNNTFEIKFHEPSMRNWEDRFMR